MGHSSHHHDHSWGHGKKAKIIFSIILNFIITGVQLVGGVFSGSLSLISDALHNFSDAFALVTSYIAIRLSEQESTAEKTFGYKRAEIMAALFNAAILILASFALFRNALERLISPQPDSINSSLMILVASIGFLANTSSVLLLRKDAHDNINMRSAYVHLFTDALTSLAVIAGGILIYFYHIYWIDPVLSIAIGIYVIKEGYSILSTAISILMQHTPEHIDVLKIQQIIEEIDGVKNIHHVHIWQLTEETIHFEAHINVSKDMLISESCLLKDQIEMILKDKFEITHVILQLEYDYCKNIPLINK
ncbi:MAG: cation transporter [Candidatus Margulisiibacteriota bacterium]|nr:MAG: cobalt transporter [Candidatus Margulisbacteria bacterium GWD2_39_127]OGI05282.1 MAG: cobalt transporter [Candidatus Margulisbacteria bacterium GWF2_38_17]OGI10859.1 MAG: cobalt transporter [Candidatus Margulisbacteria bacterium GWE2_39_32]PZM83546.1 MAG: cation transporter [Candidatus Margulisiibacteriota bacterium]HAR64276.1 cation transporter [Candidatus Margulisiibacteriota bacterium]